MKFCTQCGQKLNGDEAACPSCGKVLKEETRQEEQSPVAVKPARKSKKVLYLALVLLVAACAVFYFYGSSRTDPQNRLDDFQTALRTQNASAMTNLLAPGVEGMSITEETSESLIDYLNENEAAADSMMAVFQDQIRSDGKTKMPEEYPQITLKKGENKWLFFPSCQFELQPYYADVTVNYKGTKLQVDGQSYGSTKKDGETVQVGPFAPGEYTVKANYTGEYGKETKEADLNFFDTLETNTAIDMEMSGSAVVVSSNYPEADLYLNGEYTGYAVSDFKELGTLKRDGTNTLQAYYDFGFSEGYSDEVTVTKQKTVDLTVEPNQRDVYEGIKSTTGQHVYEWIDAFSSKDTSYLTIIRDSSYMERQEKNIQGLNNENAYWTGSLNYLRFDADSMDVDQGEDGLMYATINVETNISGQTYNEFSGDLINENDSSSFWKYDFVYDEYEDAWFITGATTIKGLSGDNIETVR